MQTISLGIKGIDPGWQGAFGKNDAIADVLSCVQKHWAHLQPKSLEHMDFKSTEPRITKRFRLWLNKSKQTFGLSGFFVAEDEVGELDEVTGKVAKPGRTDITYFSDRCDPPLKIIFEFKKLKPSTKKDITHYCEGGIQRFVNGTYGPDNTIAFMVGLIKNQSTQTLILDGLRSGIQKHFSIQQRILPDGTYGAITLKGKLFPSCDFETSHARNYKPNCPDILLGHFLLSHEP